MEEINLFNEILCVPATIRKCEGFVIEATSIEPKKSETLEVLKMLQSMGFKSHGLRYSDNDRYEPKEIYNGSVIGNNRFGWFLTKDEMEFPTNELQACVQLSTRNKKYYSVKETATNGFELINKNYYVEGSCIEINKMLDDSEIMGRLYTIKRITEIIKEIKIKYRRNRYKI